MDTEIAAAQVTYNLVGVTMLSGKLIDKICTLVLARTDIVECDCCEDRELEIDIDHHLHNDMLTVIRDYSDIDDVRQLETVCEYVRKKLGKVR